MKFLKNNFSKINMETLSRLNHKQILLIFQKLEEDLTILYKVLGKKYQPWQNVEDYINTSSLIDIVNFYNDIKDEHERVKKQVLEFISSGGSYPMEFEQIYGLPFSSETVKILLDKSSVDFHTLHQKWCWFNNKDKDIASKIIKMFPNENWDFQSITIYDLSETIENHPEKDWDFNRITTIVPFKMIENHPDKNWYWKVLHYHKDFNIELCVRYPDKDWDFYEMSGMMKLETIIKYHYLPWRWDNIYKRKDFTWSLFEQFPNKNWDMYEISKYDIIDFNVIQRLNDKQIFPEWDWYHLVRNKFLDMNYVEKHTNLIKETYWYPLSKHPKLTPDIVENSHNIKKHIIWDMYSARKDLTVWFIERNLDKNWDWGILYLQLSVENILRHEQLKKYFYEKHKQKCELLKFAIYSIESPFFYSKDTINTFPKELTKRIYLYANNVK